LSKKRNTGHIIIVNLKLYSRTIVTKQYGTGIKTDISLHSCHLILEASIQKYALEKRQLLEEVVLGKPAIHMYMIPFSHAVQKHLKMDLNA
jgi:hypothetical protein